MKKFILFLSLCALGMNATLAQTMRGCLVGNELYTEPSGKGNNYFLRSPGNLTSICGFRRVGNTSNCRLYNSGEVSAEGSYTLYSSAGSSGWVEISNCPVDNDIWMLFVPISLFSAFTLVTRKIDISKDNRKKVNEI